jgi:phage I-like protein
MKGKVHKQTAGKSRMALSVSLVEAEGKRTPPSEFRIFAFGENPSEKGTFTFDQQSATEVMEAYARHSKPMLLDYNHGTTIPVAAPEVGIAAGEFIPEVRADGIWATQIVWTARATELLAAGEYRLFSPYFEHKEGRITRLINVALTNLPALDGIQPLVAAAMNDDDKGDPMDCAACTALTAKLTAAEAELSALKGKLSMFEKDKDEEKTKATALVALTGQQTYPAALGVIEAWKTKALGYDKLATESAEREATALRADLTNTLDQAAKDGKVPPAGKESLEKAVLAMGGGKPSAAGLEWLKAHVTTLPKLVPTAAATQSPTGVLGTGAEAKMSRLMNVDEAKFQEWQAKQAAAGR